MTPAAVRGAGLLEAEAADTERSWPAAATSDAAEGFDAGALLPVAAAADAAAAGAAMAAVAFIGGACGTAAMVSGGAIGTVSAGAVGTAYAAEKSKTTDHSFNIHETSPHKAPCQHRSTISHSVSLERRAKRGCLNCDADLQRWATQPRRPSASVAASQRRTGSSACHNEQPQKGQDAAW